MEVIVQALAAREGFWWLSPARLCSLFEIPYRKSKQPSGPMLETKTPPPPQSFKVLLTGAVLDGQADAQEAGNEIPSILGRLDAELHVAME